MKDTIRAIESECYGPDGEPKDSVDQDTTYTELGAASYTVSGSDYPYYWTQVFARPRL
jgi:hypothetical protein